MVVHEPRKDSGALGRTEEILSAGDKGPGQDDSRAADLVVKLSAVSFFRCGGGFEEGR